MTPIELVVPVAGGVEEWIQRMDRRTADIGIMGLGYVGLPLALLFSEERFRVTGFDIDETKVRALNEGASYIHRIEPEHIHAAQKNGFRATADFAEIARMDAILICVPTPLHEDHTPDMSYVVSTIEAIAPHLRAGQLVVLESTTYPGTTEEMIVETIDRVGASRGVQVLRSVQPEDSDGTRLDGVMVAFSPEREDPGNMIYAAPRDSEGDWRCGCPGDAGGVRFVRQRVSANSADVDACGGGDDEAAREYLSLREHCAGE